MKTLAVITLLHPMSRAASERWGPFLRVKDERNHWWLGRKLTIEEFNTEFPKAVKFAGTDRPLVGLIYVENEDGQAESTEPVAMITVAEHEAKIADIQAGVNDWQAEQNAKIEAAQAQITSLEQARDQAQARILELEAQIAASAAKPTVDESTDTLSKEPAEVGTAPGSEEPDSPGAVDQATPPDSPVDPAPDIAPEPTPETATTPKVKSKAKK